MSSPVTVDIDKQIPHFQSDEWKKISSMNNLNAVYQLHCQGEPLEKETRNVFIQGTMTDVRKDFQVGGTLCPLPVIVPL